MARYKDFGSGSDTPAPPLTFKIYDEEFSCRTEMQGKALLDLVAKSTGASDDPGESAKIISEFFTLVLLPESNARFDALTNDPDRIVNVETLGEIVGWLVEQYSDRPTPRPEALPSGQ
jgi:hypothetical protein